jgi:hypothetical protein
MRKLLVLIALCSILPLSAAGQSGLEAYERRLIPITASNVPGPFGTKWSTLVWVVQEGEGGRLIGGPEYVGLPVGGGNSNPYGLSPPPTGNEPPGGIMYVPREAAALIHISARLYEHGSLPAQEIPLPVVTEDEVVNQTRYFAGLANNSSERVHLRVYSLDLDRPNAAVQVRVQAQLSGGTRFIYDQEYPLQVQQRYTSLFGREPFFPIRPLAVEVLLDPILRQAPDGVEIAVSVKPVDDLRVWAVLSETNMVTQRVRVSLPD